MSTGRDQADKAVSAILVDMIDRGGLSDAWDALDGPTQDYIRREWARLIRIEMAKGSGK